MPDVTCVGVLVADVIVWPVNSWPEPGRLIRVDGVEVHSGGLAHSTAVALAKLGKTAAVVGRVGSDLLGTFLIDALHAHKVESHVVRDEAAPTSTTVVAVSGSGERSFLHLAGANAHLVPQDVPVGLTRASRWLHLGGYFLLPNLDGVPAAQLLRRAKEAGCRTSLDVAWDAQSRWFHVFEPCLPYLDLLFGNRDELAHVTGASTPSEMAAFLRERGPEIVAVKLGPEGAYVDSDEWRGHAPAYEVDAIDTTGAGDTFCAGFLAGCLEGWDIPRVTRFANAVGAMCVTAVGGTTGIRSMEETIRFADGTPFRS
ncbi:MAG TPA: carbohydrate kinase family protein [bacterium]